MIKPNEQFLFAKSAKLCKLQMSSSSLFTIFLSVDYNDGISIHDAWKGTHILREKEKVPFNLI